MRNLDCRAILREPAIRSGLSLFLSGMAFCSIGRYMKIEGQPLAFQIKSFSIAAIAQTAIHATLGFSDENSESFNIITPVILIGIVAKKSRFKKLVVSTSLVSIGCFVINAGLKRLGNPPPPPPEPEPPRPVEDPLPEPAELTLNPRVFEERLLAGTLPNNKPIIVSGDLYLGTDESPERARITWLPDNLTINGLFNLAECKNLERLPENLIVHGSLILGECSNLEGLPLTLQIDGGLNIAGCIKIESLPISHYNGNLLIEDCTSLTSLPENLYVAGDVYAGGNVFEYLPSGLSVGGNLRLGGCNKLLELPQDIQNLGGLTLVNCPLIEALPEGLRIGAKGLCIIDCDKLHALPRDIRIEGNLRLSNDIEELPDNLYIGGDFRDEKELGKGLKKLPNNLFIGGNLILKNTSIESIPEDLTVEGDILLSGRVWQFPSWIAEMGAKKDGSVRTIAVGGTRISRANGEMLRDKYSRNPDVNLILPEGIGEEYFDIMFPGFYPYNSSAASESSILRSGLLRRHLTTLGIDHLGSPTERDVTRAYKRLALECHPDKVQGKEEQFRQVEEAKTALLDALSRR